MMGVMANRLAAGAAAAAEDRAVDTLSRWMAAEQKRVFLLCCRFLQDRDEADSAAQDVFLKAFRALRRGDVGELEDPARWLTRVAVNTCLDRLRSQRWQFWRKRPDPDDEQVMLLLVRSPAPDAESQAVAAQIAGRLSEALNSLSPRQRAVFLLRHYEGMRLEEIGRTLGLETGTVKAHLARAIARLREDLKDLYGLSRARNAGKETRR